MGHPEDVKPIHDMRRANATSKLIVIEGFESNLCVKGYDPTPSCFNR